MSISIFSMLTGWNVSWCGAVQVQPGSVWLFWPGMHSPCAPRLVWTATTRQKWPVALPPPAVVIRSVTASVRHSLRHSSGSLRISWERITLLAVWMITCMVRVRYTLYIRLCWICVTDIFVKWYVRWYLIKHCHILFYFISW